jgi:CBS domain-containing protein
VHGFFYLRIDNTKDISGLEARQIEREKEEKRMNTSITVGQVLRKKGHGFYAIGPDATAYEALELMADKNVGALMVTDNGKLVGVFSERDYARKVILKGKASKSTTVREIMTGSPISVKPAMTLRECMVLMTHKRIRHLPILDNDVILGVISIGDVVNTIISEQESVIEELQEYIAGTGYRA